MPILAPATSPLVDLDVMMKAQDFAILVPTEAEADGIFPGIDFTDEAYGIRRGQWRGWPVYIIGVGKANAALSSGIIFSSIHPKRAILVGIAGAYRQSGLSVGRTVSVLRDHFVDDGMLAGGRMRPLSDFGFPVCPGNRVGFRVLPGCSVVDANTVSLLSASTGLARIYHAATHAAIESMEGAAVGLAAMRTGTEIAQLRGISNYCGERTMQEWDVPAAVSSLRAALDEIVPPRN